MDSKFYIDIYLFFKRKEKLLNNYVKTENIIHETIIEFLFS